jgi:hypothetical protein
MPPGLIRGLSGLLVKELHITNSPENDETLEAAQRIIGHADSRTTNSMTAAGRKFSSKTWSETDMMISLKRHVRTWGFQTL